MAYTVETDGRFMMIGALAQRFLEDDAINELVTPHYSWGRLHETRELDSVSLATHSLTDDQIDAMLKHAAACRDARLTKTLTGIRNFAGKVPNFDAFEGMLVRFLRSRMTKSAWLYRHGSDGHAYPVVATGWRRSEPRQGDRDERPSLQLACASNRTQTDESGYHSRGENYGGGVTFSPSDVIHKTVEQALNDAGLFLETPELRAAYDAQHAHFDTNCAGKFGEQFRLDRSAGQVGKKIIYDTENNKMEKLRRASDNSKFVMDADGDPGAACPVPVHPFVRVFRLDTHDFAAVNCVRLTPYVYDGELANKLILPETHMDILDVLTTDTRAFLTDIIEGKSSGNIILCKGSPGVGKTLTAEVYSEIVKRPLYNLHSGELGTTPDSVEKEIRKVFDRVKRWNCVLLLDEADVFVAQRGADLVQNSIVAVFLRVLEYNDALMFMTTNRSDNIDDAIVSRCAAIIHYAPPDRRDRAAIWGVMATNSGVELPEGLVAQLIDTFPTASPRDIKHLMRLALRVQAHTGEPLSDKLFRRVGAFRAVDIAEAKAEPMIKPVPRERRRDRTGAQPNE